MLLATWTITTKKRRDHCRTENQCLLLKSQKSPGCFIIGLSPGYVIHCYWHSGLDCGIHLVACLRISSRCPVKPLDAKDIVKQCGWGGDQYECEAAWPHKGSSSIYQIETLSSVSGMDFSRLLSRLTMFTLRSGDFNPSLIMLFHKQFEWVL